jgi:hypothetical protein
MHRYGICSQNHAELQHLVHSLIDPAQLSSPGSEVQRGRAPKVATHRGSLPASQWLRRKIGKVGHGQVFI